MQIYLPLTLTDCRFFEERFNKSRYLQSSFFSSSLFGYRLSVLQRNTEVSQVRNQLTHKIKNSGAEKASSLKLLRKGSFKSADKITIST